MPIVYKAPPKAKTTAMAKKPKVANKLVLAQARIQAVLEKLRLANTPMERKMYLKRLSEVQGQFNKTKKKAA